MPFSLIGSRTLACTVLLCATLPALAQHDREAAPITPAQIAAARTAPLNPRLPTLFIVGDSTARNNADLGWGDHLAPLFNTAQINVANRAIAGRSSRSYIAEGHWADLLAELKPGDYVLIQMGHNDGAGTPDSVLHDPKNRTSLKGDGDETVEIPVTEAMAKAYASGPFAGKTAETVHTYGWNIRKMIDESKAKGAIPMVVTPTVRNIWSPCANNPAQRCIERDMGFRDLDIKIAAEEKVYLIDMATLAANAFESMGEKETAAFFPIDHTHTNALGAEINANCVARAILLAHTVLAEFEMGHD
jgi:lysophospholipase L1-like esterase